MGFITNQRRVRCLKEGEPGEGAVVYWMSRDQRVQDNWALIYAQEVALQFSKPLSVVFCLAQTFLDAALRQYVFMLEGLMQLQSALEQKNVQFDMITGDASRVIPEYVRQNRVGVLISDFDPLRIKQEWKEGIKKEIEIPFFEVEARNIVPCWIASGKQEYGAYTIRPKIRRLLDEYLDDFPTFKKHPHILQYCIRKPNWDDALKKIRVNRSVRPVDWMKPGESEARRVLDDFLKRKLDSYHLYKNDPNKDFVSNLSPYLHFGQISSQRIALEVKKSNTALEGKENFLEELVIRRELSDNYCYYNPSYDSPEGFPRWARESLEKHRHDRREYIYDLDQLERSKTHDPLWNAAQIEMVTRGKMHGYLRMYWAKKILEWTPNVESAMKIAVFLNDKYELDGRDPNGYTGIAWALGGVHDRAWFERSIFGKVRYMSFNGCRSKFNVPAYIDKVKKIV